MPFFDDQSGALTLPTGHQLTGRMPKAEVLRALESLSPRETLLEENRTIPFPSLDVPGGRVALLAFLAHGLLKHVHIFPTGIGQKTVLTAEQQRAFLFSLVRLKDPCPDTGRSCQITCPFGSLGLSTDPRTGFATLRLSYH